MASEIALPIEETGIRQAKHHAVITLAAKIRDWQTLLFAVDDMIVDQRDFVAWWDGPEGVRDKGGERWFDVAERRHQGLSAEEAKERTGIDKRQAYRWRMALGIDREHPQGQTDLIDAYRDRIVEAAQRKAGFSKDPAAERGQPLRDGADFWPTPDSLIEAARKHIVPVLPPVAIWECACGDGRLGRAIGATIMTDKYPQDGSQPLDFITDVPPADDLIAFTNQPFNAADAFLKRGLGLLDAGMIRGLVLLLRHDHFMAGGKVTALNRATLEVHCNWRPKWIPDTLGNPRWAFAWVYWGETSRQPPLYLKEN